MRIKSWLGMSFYYLFPLVLVLALGWFLRSEQEIFLISDASIDIQYSESQKSLVSSLTEEIAQPIRGLKGRNIWSVDLFKIQQEVEKHPWVESVDLRRRFPNKIVSSIKVPSVAFLFVDKKNRIFPVLQSGEKVKALSVPRTPLAPILRNSKILQDPDKKTQLIHALQEVPSLGPLRKSNRSTVDWDSVAGLKLELVDESVTVFFGKTNISTKALQVLRVLDYLKSQKQKARVIDASFTKKVLVRPRKRS